MDLGIAGKVALVTGGARGIGLAIAQRLHLEGCRVAVCDIDADARLGLPEGIAFTRCDISSETECSAMIARLEQAVGPIDILVNNAGIQSVLKLHEATVEDFERVLAVNLTGAFVLCRLLVPEMKERGWGRVVNISSMAGKVGGLTVSAAYAASKAGMLGLTKSVARAGAPEVTSNALAPAFIATQMTEAGTVAEYSSKIPVGRLGTPEEVAAATAFLASGLAGYITGEVFDLNGGMLMD